MVLFAVVSMVLVVSALTNELMPSSMVGIRNLESKGYRIAT